MNETLFELTNTLQQLMDLAGSDDPEEQQAFSDTLEAVKGEIGVKADSYVYVIKMLEGNAEKCKRGAEYLAGKAARLQDNVARMKKTILYAVEQVPPDKKGRRKIEGDMYTFTAVKNGGKIPVIIDDETAVPDSMYDTKIVKTIDKDKIRAAIEEDYAKGKNLVTYAHLGERGTHLGIK